MVVIVVAACPPGLRGELTRWLLEVSPGTFVGRLSKRVRERVWQRVVEGVGTGRATIVWRANNEQGLEFLTHGDTWKVSDFDGISLITRPNPQQTELRRKGVKLSDSDEGGLQQGWSMASRNRRR
ncbi:type I-E CRISPR-associated endoribonuclease Cas2e [Brevibacterium casei]|uniref:CRISPR-associated protein n=1 Tax=Brevibacterium casei S18 TaxID=1229781 RepID=K9AE10_9MICO|nr:type I-E CRISPR-associated endoribonuclease Cas2e [Brevibacterium casei]EKU45564.1 CRISPR-associated protein [Brevibacterium casei S18]